MFTEWYHEFCTSKFLKFLNQLNDFSFFFLSKQHLAKLEEFGIQNLEFVKLCGEQHFDFESNNTFIRCLHQFVSLIFSKSFSQFKQLKKKTNFLLVKNSFILSSLQLKSKINKFGFRDW